MATPARAGRPSAVEPLEPAETAEALFERHGAAVLRFCRSRLRSLEEAEDARQTTFLRALGALSRGVVPLAELSWLLKIADNVCRTRREDARRRIAFELPEDPAELGEIAAPAGPDRELLMPLEEALDRLTDAQRQALLLREWQGLTAREIAARLGISQGAVEVLLFRARRALAEELEAPGRVRRRQRALDLGWLAGAVKQLLGGGAAIGAKPALTAVALAVAAVVSTTSGALADTPAQQVGEPSWTAPPAPLVVPRETAQAAVPPPKSAPRAEPQRPEPGRRSPAPRVDRPAEAPSSSPAAAPLPTAEAQPPAPAPARRDPVSSTVETVAPAAEEVAETAETAVAELTETVEATLEEAPLPPAPLPPAPLPPAPLPPLP